MFKLINLVAKVCLLCGATEFTVEASGYESYYITIGSCKHAQLSVLFDGEMPVIYAIYP
jgi:hypothetical protein